MTGRPLLLLALVATLAACSSASDDEGADATADTATAAVDVSTSPPDVPVVRDDLGQPDDVVVLDVPPAPDAPPALDTPSRPDVAVVPGAKSCALDQRLGGFDIEHAGFYASAAGEVAGGVIPLTVLEAVASEGPCRLMRKNNPFCDPGCAAGDLCDHDGTCLPYPSPQPLGTVTVTGLLVDGGTLVMEPKGEGIYFDTSVPLPLFEPGAPISLTAAGDALPGFVLEAAGVEDLSTGEAVLTAEVGTPLELTWVASQHASEIHVRINVDQHGITPLNLVCDLEDSGSHQVPAALLDQLLTSGISGFPTFHMYRQRVDSVTVISGPGADAISGCVELRVRSFLQRQLAVAGHTPCKNAQDCPMGQVCDTVVETCVDD